jgi:branched-subunit amino acid ABC-type transport system permease component
MIALGYTLLYKVLLFVTFTHPEIFIVWTTL